MVIALLAGIQLLFTFAIAFYASFQVATFNTGPIPVDLFDTTYDWTCVVLGVSWFQVVLMSFNFVFLTMFQKRDGIEVIVESSR